MKKLLTIISVMFITSSVFTSCDNKSDVEGEKRLIGTKWKAEYYESGYLMVLEFSGDEIIGYIEGPNGMYSHGLCSGKYSLNNNEIVFTDFIMQFSHDWYYTFVSGEIFNSLMKVQIINTISDWEVHNFTAVFTATD